MKRIITSILLIFICLSGFTQGRILIAAASDLKFALDSMIVQFNQSTKGKVDVTYGSSGKLSEQINNGAPFDIFFSADISYPEMLKKNGKAASEIYRYGKGRIVIWSTRIDPTLNEIKSLINPFVKKIAIANPQHAPYGKRALECIEYYKLEIKNKLVYGENISQTAQFVSTGAADAGIIALSLALSPNMQKENGKFYLIPEESHRPLIQGAIITTNGKDKKLATEFFDYTKSETAKAILKHFGFTE